MIDMVMSVMFCEAFRKQQPETAAQFREKLNRPNDDGSYFTNRAVLERGNVLEDLKGVKVPVLVVTSSGDTAVPAKHGSTIAQAIAGAELVEIPDAGHMTAVERPGFVNEALASFFDKHMQ